MKGFRKTAAVLLTSRQLREERPALSECGFEVLAMEDILETQTDDAYPPAEGIAYKLNYISVNVTISLTDSRDYELVQKHEPMIKDAITDTLGAVTLKQINEPGSRNTIRDKVREVVIRLLDDCVGRRIVKDVMFSDFKWQ